MNTFEISPFRLEGDVWLILDQTRLCIIPVVNPDGYGTP